MRSELMRHHNLLQASSTFECVASSLQGEEEPPEVLRRVKEMLQLSRFSDEV